MTIHLRLSSREHKVLTFCIKGIEQKQEYEKERETEKNRQTETDIEIGTVWAIPATCSSKTTICLSVGCPSDVFQ